MDCVCTIPSVDGIYDPVNVCVSEPQQAAVQRQTGRDYVVQTPRPPNVPAFNPKKCQMLDLQSLFNIYRVKSKPCQFYRL